MAESRLGAQSDEVLTDANPARQLAAVSVESITNSGGSPARQLAAISVESLTNAANGSATRQLAGISVEVLVPTRFTFVGWGYPIKSSVWS